MLLPIHTNGLIAHHTETPAGDSPVRPRDCFAAVVLFAMAVIVALLVLGTDWQAVLTSDERPLPEATRMMVIAPLPR